MNATTKPLAGIRVADFTWVGVGPYATKVLADHGATVIKIESRRRIDPIRLMHPHAGGKAGVDRSGYFAERNTNKQSVTLNLKHAEGRRMAWRLIESCDVICNNFSPGVLDRFGLGYEEVARACPSVIYVDMPMQGTTGPHASYSGYGVTLAALTGLMWLTRGPNDPPLGSGTNYPDHAPNPLHASLAILAAILHRRRTGEGQRIEISQYESTLNVLGPALLAALESGRNPEPSGNSEAGFLVHDVFRCRGEDEWCTVSVCSPDQWNALCHAIGRSDLRCGSQSFPVLRTGLETALQAWMEERSKWDAMRALQAAGVTAGVVSTAEDLVRRDPQLAHRGHWVYLNHPEMGHSLYSGIPFRMSRTPGALCTAAPRLGEHTRSVFVDELRVPSAEFVALCEQGAFD
jgi:benzylsuccinate CoA-transferase BbsF subunit